MTNLINNTLLNDFPNDIILTKLCTHKNEASLINQKHLDELDGQKHSFISIDQPADSSSMLDSLTIVPNKLDLKVGTKV